MIIPLEFLQLLQINEYKKADYPLDYRKSAFLYRRLLSVRKSLFVGSALSQSS